MLFFCAHNMLEMELKSVKVLPTVLRIDPELRHISPVTIQLVLLASTVICLAFWQFYAPLNPTSRLLPPQPPVLLVSSAMGYLGFLGKLCQSTIWSGGKLTQAIFQILDHVIHGLGETELIDMHDALLTLSHYRWCGEGTGIIECTDEVALSNMDLDPTGNHSRLCLPAAGSVNDIASRRAAIESLCRSDARICTPECFDLNIRFLPSLKGRADDSLNPPIMSVGFRLNYIDNRLLRKGTSDRMLYLPFGILMVRPAPG